MSGAALGCEKCGSDDVLTRWHGEGAYHSSRKLQACWSDYGEDRGKPREEHLHYHCRGCQFSWTGPLTPTSTRPTAKRSAPAPDGSGVFR